MSETVVCCTPLNVADDDRAGKLPTKAGKATLVFRKLGEPEDLPFREGDTIMLPFDDDSKMVSLQEGRQFLFCSGGVWFGGTDVKTVFLTPVSSDQWKIAKCEGEEAFYRSLVPQVIIGLQVAIGLPWKRQGDMFFYPVPHLPVERVVALIGLGIKAGGWELELFDGPEKVDDCPLFGTSHKLTGTIFADDLLDIDVDTKVAVVTGTVAHPEHDPLVLEETHIAIFSEVNSD